MASVITLIFQQSIYIVDTLSQSSQRTMQSQPLDSWARKCGIRSLAVASFFSVSQENNSAGSTLKKRFRNQNIKPAILKAMFRWLVTVAGYPNAEFSTMEIRVIDKQAHGIHAVKVSIGSNVHMSYNHKTAFVFKKENR
jgi:hypothetical protein